MSWKKATRFIMACVLAIGAWVFVVEGSMASKDPRCLDAREMSEIRGGTTGICNGILYWCSCSQDRDCSCPAPNQTLCKAYCYTCTSAGENVIVNGSPRTIEIESPQQLVDNCGQRREIIGCEWGTSCTCPMSLPDVVTCHNYTVTTYNTDCSPGS
jgi:hypothetical protein